MTGIVVVDKPEGRTSAQVVADVRRLMREPRAGHTGTLDPMATGVLPVCLGDATRIAGWLLADDKGYEAELELGVATDTLDATGAVIAEDRAAAAQVTRAQLDAAAARFVGAIEQVPPMFSAKKLGRWRLHELARAGEVVEREARTVTIHELRVLDFTPPRARLAIACSKGTYVRTLVDDLGRALGCGAHLTALRRTRSGPFTLAHAVAVADLSPATPLVRPVDALAMPQVAVPPALVAAVWHANPALLWDLVAGQPENVPFLMVGEDARLLAVCRRAGERLHFERVLPRES